MQNFVLKDARKGNRNTKCTRIKWRPLLTEKIGSLNSQDQVKPMGIGTDSLATTSPKGETYKYHRYRKNGHFLDNKSLLHSLTRAWLTLLYLP